MDAITNFNTAISNFCENTNTTHACDLKTVLQNHPEMLNDKHISLIESAIKHNNIMKIEMRIEYSSSFPIDNADTFSFVVLCTQILVCINISSFNTTLGLPIIIGLMRNAIFQIPQDSIMAFSILVQQFSQGFHGKKLDKKSGILLSEIIAYVTFLPGIDERRKLIFTTSLTEMLDHNIFLVERVALMVACNYFQTYEYSYNVVCVIIGAIHSAYNHSCTHGDELTEELATLFTNEITQLTPYDLRNHYIHLFLDQAIGQLRSGRESEAFQFSSLLAEKLLKLLHPASVAHVEYFCNFVARFIPSPIRERRKELNRRNDLYIPLKRTVVRKIWGGNVPTETHCLTSIDVNLKIPIYKIRRYFTARKPSRSDCHKLYVALAQYAIDNKDPEIVHIMNTFTKEYHQPFIKQKLLKNLQHMAMEVYEFQPAILYILLAYTYNTDKTLRDNAILTIQRIIEDKCCEAKVVSSALRSVNKKTPILRDVFTRIISGVKNVEKYRKIVSELIDSHEFELPVAIVSRNNNDLISPHTLSTLIEMLRESSIPRTIGMTVVLIQKLIKLHGTKLMAKELIAIFSVAMKQYIVCRDLATHYSLESFILQLMKLQNLIKPKVRLYCVSLFDDLASKQSQLSYWDAQRCVSAMHLLEVPGRVISESVSELVERCGEKDAFQLTNINYLSYKQKISLLECCDPGITASLISHQIKANREVYPMLLEHSTAFVLNTSLNNLSDRDMLATLGTIIRQQQVEFSKCMAIIVAMCFNVDAFISHTALGLLSFMCIQNPREYIKEFMEGITLLKDSAYSTELFPEIWSWWKYCGIENHSSKALESLKNDSENSKWVRHVISQGAKHNRVDKWEINVWLNVDVDIVSDEEF